jgi:hypothetical protein
VVPDIDADASVISPDVGGSTPVSEAPLSVGALIDADRLADIVDGPLGSLASSRPSSSPHATFAVTARIVVKGRAHPCRMANTPVEELGITSLRAGPDGRSTRGLPTPHAHRRRRGGARRTAAGARSPPARATNAVPACGTLAPAVVDLEADRLRALMRATVFGQPRQPVTIDRYEIVRLLGSGAMGLVYEVFDPKRGEQVALKTLRGHSPRALSLFKREFRALSRITHPNLVALYELGRDEHQFFFTMELVRGSALLKYLWGSEPADTPSSDRSVQAASHLSTPSPTSPRLRAVFAQLAEGVHALHQAHKLHRDIKPTNVMVTPQGRVVLMDFGFVGEESVGTLESTAGSMVVGTPAYMAPEQATRRPAGARLRLVLARRDALHSPHRPGPVPGRDPPAHDGAQAARPPAGPPHPRRRHPRGPRRPVHRAARPRPQGPPVRRRGARQPPPTWPRGQHRPRRLPLARRHPRRRPPLHRPQRRGPGPARRLRLRLHHQQPAVVLARGRAGLGKSALIRHVTDELRAPPWSCAPAATSATASRSRPSTACSTPSPATCASAPSPSWPPRSPPHPLFPVLQSGEGTSQPAPRRGARPQRLRRAPRSCSPAFPSRAPLVLWIDDLQWGDPGSVRALQRMLSPRPTRRRCC